MRIVKVWQSRASSMPLLFECSASAWGKMNVRYRQEGGPSAEGSAVHRAMESIVKGLEPDLDAIAEEFAIDRDELGRLTWYGRKAWATLRASFPEPEPEAAMTAKDGDIVITGTTDLRSRMGRVTHMLDWKSGYVDRDYYHQFAAYAAGEFTENPECEEVVFSGVWLRAQDIETYTFTREDIAGWWNLLRYKLARPNEFRPGPDCPFCPRSVDCPALIAQVRRDVQMFVSEDIGALFESATPDQLIAIRRRARLVAEFADSATELIRSRIQQAGPIVGTDGTKLDLVPENGRREIDAALAWPVLQANLSDEEMATVVNVSAAKAEKVLGEKAAHGYKGKAIAKFKDELKAAGAVKQDKVFKLKEIRPPRMHPTKEIAK